MRRSTAVAWAALATVLVGLPTAPSVAAAPTVTGIDGRPALPTLPPQAAEQALATATRILGGRAKAGDPDATLALRDLRLALPRLTGADRDRAEALLARPTQGANDPQHDGYTNPSKRTCTTNICVHWVSVSGDPDRATRAWVDQTMTTMNSVWKKEIGTFDYRTPRPDKTRGGNAKLDIYLKELGGSGLYGYCVPERPANKKYPFVYFGYCVLDNDFDPAQYGGAPALDSLRVTAAHEFFHAVQFAYDADEDPWFMESTATWMEERVVDSINDNRQYLPSSQVVQPHVPLDFYSVGSFNPYGNWIWWEYLSSRYGRGVVKTAWEKAGAYSNTSPDMWSTRATAAALKAHGGFTQVFAAYSSGNLIPARTYAEGVAWSVTPFISTTHLLSAGAATANGSRSVDHMSAQQVRFVPAATLTGDWEIAIHVDGPWDSTSPAARLLIERTNGTMARVAIPLNGHGDGTRRVAFSYSSIASVTLTLANASTRFSCWKGTYLSCKGVAKDDDKVFTYTAEADPV